MTPAELRAAMLKLPEPVTTDKPPHWTYWKWDLWKRVTSGENPNRFMDWPPIYHCMLVAHWPNAIEYEFNALPDDKVWSKAIEGIVPNSQKDWYKGDYSYGANLIHQAYHFHKFQSVTGKRISDMKTIVEIGGGYGAACLVARRLGFKGKYIIYDLAEFSLLQQWYLSQVGVDGVEFVTELPKKKQKTDLLIGLYSLSEMPLSLRDKILNTYPSRNYLYLYSGLWVDHDNIAYFQNGNGKPEKSISWYHEEIGHLPDRNNWYSIYY